MTDMEDTLFDHFIVIGIDLAHKEFTYDNIVKNKFDVNFLEIYPEKTEKNGEIPKYLEHFKMWVFPEGYCLYDENLNVINEQSETIKSAAQKHVNKDKKIDVWEQIQEKNKLHHFVMTDQDYTKRYCTSLVVHEKFYVKRNKNFRVERERLFAPKAISIVSRHPFFDLQKQILRFFYTKIMMPRFEPAKEISMRIPHFYVEKYKQLIDSHGKEKAEYIWESKFNEYKSDFKKSLLQQQQSLAPPSKIERQSENDYLIKESDLMEFYVSSIFSIMPITQEPSEFSVVKSNSQDNDNQTELFRYRITTPKAINLTNFSFHSLFDRLRLDNILKLFRYVLMEKQIIIFASNPRDIVYLCEALFCFISPMTWNLVYIPYMPMNLWQTLHIMVPYLIGVSKHYKDFILENLETYDKIVVDLDEGSIKYEETEEDCKFPENLENDLMKKLRKIIKEYEAASADKKEDKKNNAMNKAILSIRQAFFNFMLAIVNNYIPFFLYSQTFDEKAICSDIFDHASYHKIFPEDHMNFIKEFSSKTMMFTKFLEESYKISYLNEYLKQDCLNEINDDITWFFRTIKNMSRTTSKKDAFITSYIDFINSHYLLKILEDEQELHIKLCLDLANNPLKKDLISYIVKYIVFMEQSGIPLNDYKEESARAKNVNNNQENNLKSLLLPKFDKRKLLNLARLYFQNPKGAQDNKSSKLARKRMVDPVEMIKQNEKRIDDDFSETSGLDVQKLSEKCSILKRPEHPDKVADHGYHKSYNENVINILNHDISKEHYQEIYKQYLKNTIRNQDNTVSSKANTKSVAKHSRHPSKKGSSIFSAVEHQVPDMGFSDIISSQFMGKRNESWIQNSNNSLGISQMDSNDLEESQEDCLIGEEQNIPEEQSCVGRFYMKKKSAADIPQMSRLTSTNSKNLNTSAIKSSGTQNNDDSDAPRKTSFMNFAEKRKAPESQVPKEETQNIPVMSINKRTEEQNSIEDNSNFLIFSYLISDKFKEDSSIQFPTKKAQSQSSSKGTGMMPDLTMARMRREKIFMDADTKVFSINESRPSDIQHSRQPSNLPTQTSGQQFSMGAALNQITVPQMPGLSNETNTESKFKPQYSQKQILTCSSRSNSLASTRDASCGPKKKIFELNQGNKPAVDLRKPLETSLKFNNAALNVPVFGGGGVNNQAAGLAAPVKIPLGSPPEIKKSFSSLVRENVENKTTNSKKKPFATINEQKRLNIKEGSENQPIFKKKMI